MNEPKISIIIPIYKVEVYLERCLDSVVSQTYQNMEIILVDDGSPDQCGVICDRYAKKDDRIKVIHKENKGVSSARNTGLSMATGDWIGWVDPDDWVEPDMFEILLMAAQEMDADIAVCGILVHNRYSVTSVCVPENCLMSREMAIRELLLDKQFTNHMWNKVYRRTIFDGIVFPEGQNFEDLAIMYHLIEKSTRVYYIADIKYHYQMHMTGIMMSTELSNALNCWSILQKRYQYLSPQYPHYEPYFAANMVGAIMQLWSVAWVNRRDIMNNHKELMKMASQFSRKHCVDALKFGNYGITAKLRILLTLYPHRWAYLLCDILRKFYIVKHGH